MGLQPWYKVVTPRREVREGRSFSPDEFAIALEQVVAGTAPPDYADPKEFFSRTVLTTALVDIIGKVLRRLDGQTADTAPVLALVTQFGGGKTHTLAALYHLLGNAKQFQSDSRIRSLLRDARVRAIPPARVAVFVGNAWDPRPGHETPWIDLARQLAGARGVEALGTSAATNPPGTDALRAVFDAAEGSVLILMDEVLNFLSRHRVMAEPFYAFFQNLVRATTGTPRCVAVISLPRSQVEMTDVDRDWQERITKEARRVAQELIVNEASEIAEVVRRRLFEEANLEQAGKARDAAAKVFAEWCFKSRDQIPPEWTAAGDASTDKKSKDFLRTRFEASYPFHPATLTVFQRKWQTLPQYQQTRGTLAMLAQWVSWAYREGFEKARNEAFITLGSAPLDVPEFRSTVLGQLGEPRLLGAINADIAGDTSKAAGLDVTTSGPLRGIHRRVASTLLFESSGGMVDKVAHLPELRFAIGEPGIDTTSIDNTALALERKALYLRRVGRDGFRFGVQPTLKKIVADRKTSLEEGEVDKTLQKFIREEWERGASVPLVFFPRDGTEVPDSPRLTVVVLSPARFASDDLRRDLSIWTLRRGDSDRLYPAAIVWCARRPGRELSDKFETYLAWKQVVEEISAGLLGEFEAQERQDAKREMTSAEEDARDEVWASYQHVMLYERGRADGLHSIVIGAGHASAGDSMSERILAAMQAEGLLNESVGAAYLLRNWPTSLVEAAAWPLSGLRQSFLDGSLGRLVNPERVLQEQIIRFVEEGEFGLASGPQPGGNYLRVWFQEQVRPEDVMFDAQTFLLRKEKAQLLVAPSGETAGGGEVEETAVAEAPRVPPTVGTVQLRLVGLVPPEVWSKLGVKLIPRMRSGTNLNLRLEAIVEVPSAQGEYFRKEVAKILAELNLTEALRVEQVQ